MKVTPEYHEKIGNIVFASVYPALVNKVVRKGKTEEELRDLIKWLTGFTDKQLNNIIDSKATYKEVFNKSILHPDAKKITGVICGYRIEEIDNDVTKFVRQLDKIVDELAKGRPLEKIKRL